MKNSIQKKVINRMLLGIPLGIAMGQVFGIIFSLIMGDGSFTFVTEVFIKRFGNEINAVMIQTALNAVVGITFSASSVIWEIDEWSLVKQSGIYFTLTAFVFLPISYFSDWIPSGLTGFIHYFLIFICIFAVFWIVGYFVWKKKIDDINRKINR